MPSFGTAAKSKSKYHPDASGRKSAHFHCVRVTWTYPVLSCEGNKLPNAFSIQPSVEIVVFRNVWDDFFV